MAKEQNTFFWIETMRGLKLLVFWQGPASGPMDQNADEAAQYLLKFENVSWLPFLPDSANLHQPSTDDQTVRVIDPEVCKQPLYFVQTHVQ